MTANVRVELGARSYDVRIGSGLLAELGQFARSAGVKGGQAVVISDSNVQRLYGDAAMSSLKAAAFDPHLLTFPAGESSKNLATYSSLMDQVLGLRPAVDRRTLIVALGGGVTGDIAGFVAATALRGLDWLACPTTLLAAVDASVGGKTAVDHPAGKNLIGAFHQPRGVLIDVATLRTLSDAELTNGLAECVKHAVIRDGRLLDFLEQNHDAIRDRAADTLTELVRRNVAIKAAVVGADERESGQRAHLNLGHTVGHAIENLLGYGGCHGQAVAMGMVVACELSRRRGLIDQRACEHVRGVLAALSLPVRWSDLGCAQPPTADAIWQAMQHDKKNLGGKVRMVLPTGLGSVGVFDDIDAMQIHQAIEVL